MTVQPGRRLLLIGSGWGAESLSRQLREQTNPWQVTACSGRQANPTAGADLLLWLLQEAIEPNALDHELGLWRQQWPQTPLLLVLPAQHRYKRQWLLERSVEGLLDQPAADAIAEALEVLAAGGRVIELQPETTTQHQRRGQGLGHRLLCSGVDQIERELEQINAVLQLAPIHPLQRFVLEGRRRELRMAREVLHLLWGQEPIPQAQASAPAEPLQIVLANRKGLTVLHTVEERLAHAVASLDEAQPSPLLALEALLPDRRRQLFEALLLEFRLLVERLQADPTVASSLWSGQQPLLRERALQQLVGAYTQLPREGALVHLGDALVSSSDLKQEDPELADLLPSLLALIEGRPLLIDGGLQAPDEPAALLHLQRLVSNWLIRNGVHRRRACSPLRRWGSTYAAIRSASARSHGFCSRRYSHCARARRHFRSLPLPTSGLTASSPLVLSLSRHPSRQRCLGAAMRCSLAATLSCASCHLRLSTITSPRRRAWLSSRFAFS